MANVLVTADLHLDLWKRTDRNPFSALPDTFWHGLDALIVAGDLSNDPERKWPRHLKRLVDLMGAGKVYVLPGNHDYYDICLGDDGRLGALCADAGATLVQKSELHFGRWRFLCTTLWTDLTLAGDTRHSADYRRIRNPDDGALHPSAVRRLHDEQLDWLENALEHQWDGATAVVTHHAPHPCLLSDHTPALFASDLERVITRHAPDLWLFGHTHFPTQAHIGATLVRNVSFGGPNDVPDDGIKDRLMRGLIDVTTA